MQFQYSKRSVGAGLAAAVLIVAGLTFALRTSNDSSTLVSTDDELDTATTARPGAPPRPTTSLRLGETTTTTGTTQGGGARRQSLRFDALPESFILGEQPRTMTATAESGLPVSITAEGACTADQNGVIVPTDEGTCTVRATQAGDSTWAPATIEAKIAVRRAIGEQDTVQFTRELPNVLSVDAVQEVTASSGSGRPVVVSAQPNAVCSVQGARVTLHARGTCTVAATVAQSEGWQPATVAHLMTVLGLDQGLNWAVIPDRVRLGAPVPLSASTKADRSGVRYSASGVCKVDDRSGQVTPLQAGTCNVEASHPGDTRFEPAAIVASIGVEAVAQVQTISASQPGAVRPGEVFAVSGSSDSGLPVGVTLASGPCDQSTGSWIASSEGSCEFRLAAEGNADWLPATSTVRVTIRKQSPAITVNGAALRDYYTVRDKVADLGVGVDSDQRIEMTVRGVDSFGRQSDYVCNRQDGDAPGVVRLVYGAPPGQSTGGCTVTFFVLENSGWAAASVTHEFRVRRPLISWTFEGPSDGATVDGGTTKALVVLPEGWLTQHVNARLSDGDPCTMSSSLVGVTFELLISWPSEASTCSVTVSFQSPGAYEVDVPDAEVRTWHHG